MVRRLLHIIFIVMVLLLNSCVKDTYDMNKLSNEVHLTPSFAFKAISGDLSLSDIVKPNDTLVFDENNLLKIIIKEDSVINLKLADFINLNDMVAFSQKYTVGEVNISPFYETVNFTLNQISMNFDPALRSQFVTLDGTTNNFPAFPSTDLGNNTFPLLTNFEYATFFSGSIEISLKNNLPATLDGLSVQLYNGSDNSPIGDPAIISEVIPGELGLASIDLTDVTVTNNIVASIVLAGCDETSTPVLIDLDGSSIEVGMRGKDLKVKSGRIILPPQAIETLDNSDTIMFDPGEGIQLDSLKIISGIISYEFQSLSSISASMDIELPTALRSGVAISESIQAIPGTILTGSIVADNTVIDLGTYSDDPYNRLPLEYSIEVSSTGYMIDFDMDDEISLDIQLISPDFDFVKGYFGEISETIDSKSTDLEIEDILSNISGDFLIADPSIRLYYSNSFAIPIEVTLDAQGTDRTETVDLGLAPFIVDYPSAPDNRDISGTITIDKDNSELPELISMPPDKITFSGSAKMNPDGDNGLRDNYVFGNSRILGNLEVEVPMEFSLNLQFTDTLDNFFNDAFSEGDDFTWEDFDSFEMVFNVENGFPLGASLTMVLYDSLHIPHNLGTVEADTLIGAAPVDASGRVLSGESTNSSTSVVFTPEFFKSIEMADKVIIIFTLNTTDNDIIKIYSDYRIKFNASLVFKPDININLK